jgi:hypothetical protein
MRTARRIALVVLTVVAVLAVVAWVGGRAILNSSVGRSVAAEKLSAALGLPVEVESLNVGTASSSLGFRVMQPAADGRPADEILRVESVTADVGLGGLVRGTASPTEVTVRGATLTVRIDRDGNVLTQMPKTQGGGDTKIPAVRLENSTLRLAQEGRPEFQIGGISGQLTPANGSLTIDAKADDPRWGAWTAAGGFDTRAGTGKVDLVAANATLDTELLRSIPYIPPSTWEYVRASGHSPAKVTLALGDARRFDYRVELTPAGAADVVLPELDATVTAVRGTVRVEGQKVELREMTGRLADGTVVGGGDMDFAPDPSVLTFRVTTDKVDVRKLPAEWGLPQKIEGKLKGNANLEIRVPVHGRPNYGGGGSATVEDAKIAGLPAEIGLNLHSDGKRYRFAQDHSPAKATPKQNRSSGVRVGRPVRNARQEPAKPADAKAADEPTTLDATITLRDVDIAELLTKLEVKVPYKLGGKVTVTASVSIPVANAEKTNTYRFAGTLTSNELAFEGLKVQGVSAKVRYADGVLRLTELAGRLPPEAGGPAGSFKGTATAAVQPRGDVSAALDLDRVPLGQILRAIPGEAIAVAGPVTGRAEFRAPLEKLSDPASWVASADLRSDEMIAYGRVIRGVHLPLKVEKGSAVLKAAGATVEGIPLTADATAGLAKPYRFEATAKTAAVKAADVRRLVPEVPLPFAVEGTLDATATLTGTASPLAYTASGTVRSDELKVGTRGANKIEAAWAVDPDRVRVTKLSAELFGGTVGGTADVPFAADKAGRFDVTFKEVDTAAAAKAVPDVPVKLSGKVSGELKGTIPAGKGQTPTADLDLTAPRLTVQGIPAERLTGKLGFRGGAAEYQLEGRTLGGSFELKGRYPSRPAAPPAPADRGSLRLRGLNLHQLAGALRNPALSPLRGTVDLSFDFNNDLSEGTGEVTAEDVWWGEAEMIDRAAAGLRLRNGVLELVDVGGSVAGGRLRGRGRVPLEHLPRGYVSLTIDRADPKRLFAPVPAVADEVTGEVSLTVRGRPFGEAGGTGSIALPRGTVAGLDVTDLLLPFDWSAGAVGRHVTVRGATARVGGGRLTGDLTFNAGGSDRLDGSVKFSDVRLSSVVGGSSVFGNGRATGRFDVSASPFRTLNDLNGQLTASLNQASVRELPVIQQISPFLSPAGIAAPFQSGEVRGRLGNGVLRLERLALANSSASLYADGTVTLAGRLDLDVVAQTGNIGVNDRGLRLVGLRIPAFGPIPIGLIRDVSDLLSNRTVRLTVTGTVKSPQPRVNTAALLSEEAVRFLIGRYVPGLAGASVFGAAAGNNRK